MGRAPLQEQEALDRLVISSKACASMLIMKEEQRALREGHVRGSRSDITGTRGDRGINPNALARAVARRVNNENKVNFERGYRLRQIIHHAALEVLEEDYGYVPVPGGDYVWGPRRPNSYTLLPKHTSTLEEDASY